MIIGTILQAVVLGFVIAAPVGPIGVLVIDRSVKQGALVGLVTGLGAAFADATYAGVGAFGMGFGAGRIAASPVFRLASLLLLVLLAVQILRPKAGAEAASPAGPASLWRAFASTWLLTIANPATIASFAAAASIIAVGAAGGALGFSAGVLVGSAAWWLVLSFVAGALRLHVGRRTLAMIRWTSAMSLLWFAGRELSSLVGA